MTAKPGSASKTTKLFWKIKTYLTGMHPTSVYLMGGCLMGVYLMGVYLTGLYVTGVHITGRASHGMGMYLIGVFLYSPSKFGADFPDLYA
jgi:hypothetical protein